MYVHFYRTNNCSTYNITMQIHIAVSENGNSYFNFCIPNGRNIFGSRQFPFCTLLELLDKYGQIVIYIYGQLAV